MWLVLVKNKEIGNLFFCICGWVYVIIGELYKIIEIWEYFFYCIFLGLILDNFDWILFDILEYCVYLFCYLFLFWDEFVIFWMCMVLFEWCWNGVVWGER